MEALARRLQSLQTSVDASAAQASSRSKLAAQGPAHQSQQPGSGQGAAELGRGRTAAASAAAGPPATSGPLTGAALLAKRRVLRVIVGKGLHSAGGEASLPRVVEGYLLSNGYKYTPRAGQVEVQLRRNYAQHFAGQQPL